MLRERLELQSVQSCDRFKDLDSRTQEIISALLDTRATFSFDLGDQTIAISRMLDGLEVVMIDQHGKTRAIILDSLHQTMETLTQEVLSRIQASMTDTRKQEQALRASVAK